MSVPQESVTLQRYRTGFGEIPGFFQFESIVLWDFFFAAQVNFWVTGDFLEIGVYKGRSAVLGALYIRPEEKAVFVDLGLPEETRELIQRAKPQNNLFLERRSADVLSEIPLRDSPKSFRWCHIDGDHTGYSAMQDILSAAYLVNERGIICVDDFFNFRYPQLTAVVHQFLRDHSLEYRLLFCGANKCYICRSGAYAMYEGYIRQNLASHLRSYGVQSQVYKTSYSNDGGCFSMWTPDGDRPIYGMDENPDFVPF
ncbi:MAG TPA: class I SAM-dependent methyltransferase [Blastocatellia bacterium]|nr:class I SAM-dependent methyltransferase [Blastocatellia bacterium]